MNAWQEKAGVTTREELPSTSLGTGSQPNLIMDWRSPRNKKWIRAVAFLVIICFIHQDIVWAQGGTPIWSKAANGSFSFKGTPVNENGNITVPKDVAVTKEVYKGQSDKTIINIQDAHASLGAQESIVSILDSLVTNYDLKLVAIEGSTGYIDTSILKTFPDEKIRRQTAQYLMKKGKMSAGEFFTVTSNKTIVLYGIEDKGLYTENVKEFRKVYEINGITKKDVAGLTATLKSLEDKIYSPELKALESNSVLHKDGKITFSERWTLVNDLAVKAGLDYKKYSNLTKLVQSLKIEKEVNFSEANKERDSLIDFLSKKLAKQDLEQLILKSLAFKTGKITQGEYYVFLQGMAKANDVDPEPYKNLIAYTDYITLYESIDLLAIFEEVKNFEDAIKEKLFTSADQRELYDISKHIGLVKDLFEMNLTNDDFAYLAKDLDAFKAESLARFIRDASLKYGVVIDANYDLGKIFESIAPAMEFYRTAEKRNQVMFVNTINRMNAEGQNVAALITGGYHTRGLTDLLKKNEASYLVILPKFDASKPERPYVAILTNKKGPYEGLLKSGKYYLAPSAYFEADLAIPENVRFANYRMEFLGVLKDMVKGARNPGDGYRQIEATVKVWRANYSSWLERFNAPAGFIPKTLEEMDAQFFNPLLDELKPAAPIEEKPGITAGVGDLLTKIVTLQSEVTQNKMDIAVERVVSDVRAAEKGTGDDVVDNIVGMTCKRLNISDPKAQKKIKEAVKARLSEVQVKPEAKPEAPALTAPPVIAPAAAPVKAEESPAEKELRLNESFNARLKTFRENIENLEKDTLLAEFIKESKKNAGVDEANDVVMLRAWHKYVSEYAECRYETSPGSGKAETPDEFKYREDMGFPAGQKMDILGSLFVCYGYMNRYRDELKKRAPNEDMLKRFQKNIADSILKTYSVIAVLSWDNERLQRAKDALSFENNFAKTKKLIEKYEKTLNEKLPGFIDGIKEKQGIAKAIRTKNDAFFLRWYHKYVSQYAKNRYETSPGSGKAFTPDELVYREDRPELRRHPGEQKGDILGNLSLPYINRVEILANWLSIKTTAEAKLENIKNIKIDISERFILLAYAVVEVLSWDNERLQRAKSELTRVETAEQSQALSAAIAPAVPAIPKLTPVSGFGTTEIATVVAAFSISGMLITFAPAAAFTIFASLVILTFVAAGIFFIYKEPAANRRAGVFVLTPRIKGILISISLTIVLLMASCASYMVLEHKKSAEREARLAQVEKAKFVHLITARDKTMALPNSDIRNQLEGISGHSFTPFQGSRDQINDKLLIKFAAYKNYGNPNAANSMYKTFKNACDEFSIPAELVVATAMLEGENYGQNCLQLKIDSANVLFNNLKHLINDGKIKNESIVKMFGGISFKDMLRLQNTDRLAWEEHISTLAIFFIGNISNQTADGYLRYGVSQDPGFRTFLLSLDPAERSFYVRAIYNTGLSNIEEVCKKLINSGKSPASFTQDVLPLVSNHLILRGSIAKWRQALYGLGLLNATDIKMDIYGWTEPGVVAALPVSTMPVKKPRTPKGRAKTTPAPQTTPTVKLKVWEERRELLLAEMKKRPEFTVRSAWEFLKSKKYGISYSTAYRDLRRLEEKNAKDIKVTRTPGKASIYKYISPVSAPALEVKATPVKAKLSTFTILKYYVIDFFSDLMSNMKIILTSPGRVAYLTLLLFMLPQSVNAPGIVKMLSAPQEAIVYVEKSKATPPVVTTPAPAPIEVQHKANVEKELKLFTDQFAAMKALTSPMSGLPVDKGEIKNGTFETKQSTTSPSNIGMALASYVSARDLNIIDQGEARTAILRMLKSMENMERDGHGLFYAWYETDSPTPYPTGPEGKTISSIDNVNLTTCLKIVAEAYKNDSAQDGKTITDIASGILSSQNYSALYDAKAGLFILKLDKTGKPITANVNGKIKIVYSTYDLGTEARLGSQVLDAMDKIPTGAIRNSKATITTYELLSGEKIPVLATWDGGAFQMLMPNIFVAEDSQPVMRLLLNNYTRVMEDQGKRNNLLGANIPAAHSACQVENGEAKSAYIGAQGITELALNPEAASSLTWQAYITPHALMLAGAVNENVALGGIENLIKAAPSAYIPGFGLVDSVNIESGKPTPYKLTLDEGMSLISLYRMIDGQGLSKYLYGSDIGNKLRNILQAQDNKLRSAIGKEGFNVDELLKTAEAPKAAVLEPTVTAPVAPQVPSVPAAAVPSVPSQQPSIPQPTPVAAVTNALVAGSSVNLLPDTRPAPPVTGLRFGIMDSIGAGLSNSDMLKVVESRIKIVETDQDVAKTLFRPWVGGEIFGTMTDVGGRLNILIPFDPRKKPMLEGVAMDKQMETYKVNLAKKDLICAMILVYRDYKQTLEDEAVIQQYLDALRSLSNSQKAQNHSKEKIDRVDERIAGIELSLAKVRAKEEQLLDLIRELRGDAPGTRIAVNVNGLEKDINDLIKILALYNLDATTMGSETSLLNLLQIPKEELAKELVRGENKARWSVEASVSYGILSHLLGSGLSINYARGSGASLEVKDKDIEISIKEYQTSLYNLGRDLEEHLIKYENLDKEIAAAEARVRLLSGMLQDLNEQVSAGLVSVSTDRILALEEDLAKTRADLNRFNEEKGRVTVELRRRGIDENIIKEKKLSPDRIIAIRKKVIADTLDLHINELEKLQISPKSLEQIKNLKAENLLLNYDTGGELAQLNQEKMRLARENEEKLKNPLKEVAVQGGYPVGGSMSAVIGPERMRTRTPRIGVAVASEKMAGAMKILAQNGRSDQIHLLFLDYEAAQYNCGSLRQLLDSFTELRDKLIIQISDTTVVNDANKEDLDIANADIAQIESDLSITDGELRIREGRLQEVLKTYDIQEMPSAFKDFNELQKRIALKDLDPQATIDFMTSYVEGLGQRLEVAKKEGVLVGFFGLEQTKKFFRFTLGLGGLSEFVLNALHLGSKRESIKQAGVDLEEGKLVCQNIMLNIINRYERDKGNYLTRQESVAAKQIVADRVKVLATDRLKDPNLPGSERIKIRLEIDYADREVKVAKNDSNRLKQQFDKSENELKALAIFAVQDLSKAPAYLRDMQEYARVRLVENSYSQGAYLSMADKNRAVTNSFLYKVQKIRYDKSRYHWYDVIWRSKVPRVTAELVGFKGVSSYGVPTFSPIGGGNNYSSSENSRNFMLGGAIRAHSELTELLGGSKYTSFLGGSDERIANLNKESESWQLQAVKLNESLSFAGLYSQYGILNAQSKEANERLKEAEDYSKTVHLFDRIRASAFGVTSDEDNYNINLIKSLREEAAAAAQRRNDAAYSVLMFLQKTGQVKFTDKDTGETVSASTVDVEKTDLKSLLNIAGNKNPELNRIMKRVDIGREEVLRNAWWKVDVGVDFDSKMDGYLGITVRKRIFDTNRGANKAAAKARLEQLMALEQQVKDSLKTDIIRLREDYIQRADRVQKAEADKGAARRVYISAKMLYDKPVPEIKIGELIKAQSDYYAAVSRLNEERAMFLKTDSLLGEYIEQFNLNAHKTAVKTEAEPTVLSDEDIIKGLEDANAKKVKTIKMQNDADAKLMINVPATQNFDDAVANMQDKATAGKDVKNFSDLIEGLSPEYVKILRAKSETIITNVFKITNKESAEALASAFERYRKAAGLSEAEMTQYLEEYEYYAGIVTGKQGLGFLSENNRLPKEFGSYFDNYISVNGLDTRLLGLISHYARRSMVLRSPTYLFAGKPEAARKAAEDEFFRDKKYIYLFVRMENGEKLTGEDYRGYSMWYVTFFYRENIKVEWSKFSKDSETLAKDAIRPLAERVYERPVSIFGSTEDEGMLGALTRQFVISGWFDLNSLEKAAKDHAVNSKIVFDINAKIPYLVALAKQIESRRSDSGFFRNYNDKDILSKPEASHVNELYVMLQDEQDPDVKARIKDQIDAETSRLIETIKFGDLFYWAQLGMNNGLTVSQMAELFGRLDNVTESINSALKDSGKEQYDPRDEDKAGIFTSIAFGIVTDYNTWEDFFDPTGKTSTDLEKDNTKKLFAVVMPRIESEAIQYLLGDRYLKRNQVMAMARDIVIRTLDAEGTDEADLNKNIERGIELAKTMSSIKSDFDVFYFKITGKQAPDFSGNSTVKPDELAKYLGMLKSWADYALNNNFDAGRMREEFTDMAEVFTTSKIWKPGTGIELESLANYAKYFRELRKAYGETKEELPASTLFTWIKTAQNAKRAAGKSLLNELKKADYVWGWEISDSEKKILAGNISMIMDEPVNDQEAVYFGTEYMLQKKFDKAENPAVSIFEDMENRIYIQAAHMTYNNYEAGKTLIPRRLEAGKVGSYITLLEQKGYDRKAIGKIIRYVAYFRKQESEMGLPIPIATDSEVLGFVTKAYEKNRGMGYITVTFKDIKFLQGEEYRTQNKFFDWNVIFAILDQARNGSDKPIDRLQKYGWTRMSDTTHRQDLAFMNLGDYELTSYLLSKWKVTFGQVLDMTEVEHNLPYLLRLGKTLQDRKAPPGYIRQAQGMLIERIRDLHKGFTALAAQALYADKNNADLETIIAPQLKIVEGELAPEFADLIAGKKDREWEREVFMGRNIIYAGALDTVNNTNNFTYRKEINGERENYKKGFVGRLTDRKEQVKLENELKEIASRQRKEEIGKLITFLEKVSQEMAEKDPATSSLIKDTLIPRLNQLKETPVRLRGGDITYYIDKMKKEGYSEEEVVYKQRTVPDIVAVVYETSYNGGNKIGAKERLIASGLARVISDRLDFAQSKYKGSVLNGIKVRMKKDIDNRLKDPLLPEKIKAELREQFNKTDLFTMDDIFGQEIVNTLKTLEIAKHIKAEFEKLGKKFSDPEAQLMGHNAFIGALEDRDLEVWINAINTINSSMGALGTKADDNLLDKIIYTTDSLFEMGVTKLPGSEKPDSKAVEESVIAELARIGITNKSLEGVNIIKNVIQVIESKNIKPAVIKLLVDKLQSERRSLDNAIAEDSRKSRYSDTTKAPRSTYDLARKLSDKDLLVYLDENNPYPDEHIGLAKILGYDKDAVEKKIAKPINAMLKLQGDNLLRDEVLKGREDVWQASWSKFEKLRYHLWKDYGWGNLHSIIAGTILLGLISLAYLMTKKARNDKLLNKIEAAAGSGPGRDNELIAKIINMERQAMATNPVEVERRLENIKESLGLNKKQVVYRLASSVLSVALLLFILAGYDYNFFIPSNIIFYAAATLWLISIMPSVYILSPIVMFIIDPIYKRMKGRGLLEEYRRADITEKGKLPDDQKSMVHIAFPMRGQSDIPNFNFVLGDGRGTAGGRGCVEKLLQESNNDPNLYYTLLIQAFPKDDKATPEERERHYRETKKMVEQRLSLMPKPVRKRVYVFLRNQKLTKPPTHYSIQRWLRESDDEYRRIDPQFNVDPYIDPQGQIIDRSLMNGFIDILGGDANDPNDLKNIRQRSINSSPKDPLKRTNEIKNTLVYDPGNNISYGTRPVKKGGGEGLLYLFSVMADPRNTEYFYRGKIVYNDVNATLHSNIMKDFPQTMLSHVQQAQYVIEGSLRAPGKYAYRNDDFYKKMIMTNAYQKVWPFYSALKASDDIVPKSEDEIMTILSGKCRYVDNVIIEEDPMYNYSQEWGRESTRWMFIFDQPQMMVMRIMPRIRDHPFIAAAFVGFWPAFIITGIVGTSFLTMALSCGIAALVVGAVLYKWKFKAASNIIKAKEKSGIMWIPRLSAGHRNESNLVLRGLIGEGVWLMQLVVTFKAMLVPGSIGMLFPYLGEFAFVTIMLLIVHPKFYPAFKQLGQALSKTFQYIRNNKTDLAKAYGKAFLLVLAGLLEFTASTTIFLTKIIVKPIVLITQFPKVISLVNYNLFRPGEEPPRLTWVAAVVGDGNPLFTQYFKMFAWPMAITGLIFLSAFASHISFAASLSSIMEHAPILYAALGTAGMSLISFFAYTITAQLQGSNKKKQKEKEKIAKRYLWVLAITMLILSVAFPGFIPKDLILRASPILIASFLFSAGWSWLLGLGKYAGHGKYEETKAVKWGVYGLGAAVLLITIGATWFPQEILGKIIGIFAYGGGAYSGSGFTGMVSFQEQLSLPTIFTVFFSGIVGSSVVIGLFASIVGFGHSIYVMAAKLFGKNPTSKAGTPSPLSVSQPLQKDKGKGSVASALKTMYEKFRNQSVAVDQFNDSRDFSETTVRKELEMLELLGLVDVDKGSKQYKYMLKSEIRDLSPPQIKYICDTLGLDRYEIPQNDIQRVKDNIAKYVLSNLPPSAIAPSQPLRRETIAFIPMSKTNILKFKNEVLKIENNLFSHTAPFERFLGESGGEEDALRVDEKFSEFILVDGKVVGYVVAHKDSVANWKVKTTGGENIDYTINAALRLRRIAILTDYEHLGLGTQALNRMARKAVDQGIEKIFNRTRFDPLLEKNKQSFLQKYGFKVIGRTSMKGYISTVLEAKTEEILNNTRIKELEDFVRENRLGLIGIKQDGMKDEETIKAILKARGIEILYEKEITLADGMSKEFYYMLKDRVGPNGWKWLTEDYMAGGKKIKVLIVRSNNTEKSAIDDIRDVVGPTRGIGAPGTIRGELMTDADRVKMDEKFSKITNRVHAADSDENVVREGSILLGQEEFESILLKIARETIQSVEGLRTAVESGKLKEMIQRNESDENADIDRLASEVVKLPGVSGVFISGHSSSGKTIFTQRLIEAAEKLGRKGVRLTIDDYYKDHEDIIKAVGNLNFDVPGAIDLERLVGDINKLRSGEEIQRIHFNMSTGKRETTSEKLKLDENDILFVEGIFASLPEITSTIEESHKYSIFINAIPALRLQGGTILRSEDLRLIRRIVRDSLDKNRQYRAIETIKRWPAVMEGEVKYRSKADHETNTFLGYELAVLRKPLMEALAAARIDANGEEKVLAVIERLEKIMEGVPEAGDADVPENSISREFIGPYLTPAFIIGLPAGTSEALVNRVSALAGETMAPVLKGNIKVVQLPGGAEEFEAVLAKTKAGGIYIDESMLSELEAKPEAIKEIIDSINIKAAQIIVGQKTRAELEKIMEEIKKILEPVKAVDLNEAMRIALSREDLRPKLTKLIGDLKVSVEANKGEIAGAYNNMPMPDKAVMSNRKKAIATTEAIAGDDPFMSDNMKTIEERQLNIGNCFIYDNIYKDQRDEDRARKFVRAGGYDDTKIEFVRTEESRAALVKAIAVKTGVKEDDVVIRAALDEIKAPAEGETAAGKVLEIPKVKGTSIYFTVNTYQIALNIAEGNIPPNVEGDPVKMIFKYLPKIDIRDYYKEIEAYKAAVKIIRSAA